LRWSKFPNAFLKKKLKGGDSTQPRDVSLSCRLHSNEHVEQYRKLGEV